MLKRLNLLSCKAGARRHNRELQVADVDQMYKGREEGRQCLFHKGNKTKGKNEKKKTGIFNFLFFIFYILSEPQTTEPRADLELQVAAP